MPPLGRDIMYASNDAIIYRGTVSMETENWDPELTEKAVSKASPAYGRSFKDIYNEADGDFYKIDQQIFAPARIKIKDLRDGKTTPQEAFTCFKYIIPMINHYRYITVVGKKWLT